ncbi:MAG: hypothetical protein KatS3mg102_0848 [Planctomycetota bacterium]|nr:MAG: hypothetical protein KatS3mg102_0848 [Planctomycetota bacterium]
MSGDARLGTIEEIRARSEAFRRELQQEEYASAAGLKRGSDTAGIFERYRGLLAPSSREAITRRLEEIERALASGPAESERSALLDERRRLEYLRAELFEHFIAAEVRAISDALVTREQAATVQLAAGDVVPFRRLSQEMAATADRTRRGELERAQLAIVEEQLTPLLAERLHIESGIARALGQPSYAALWQWLHRIDLHQLRDMMLGFLRATDDMYREAMGWFMRKHAGIALEDASRHDLLAIFRGERFDDYFPKDDMVRVAERFLREMGIELSAGGHIELDLEPRDLKVGRAFCAAIEVPHRIIVVTSPEGGRRDWQRLYHELGHALHLGYTAANAPYEYRCLGDPSLGESYAFLLQYLLTDRGWLRRYLGFTKPQDYLFLVHLEKLAYLRRYSARLAYELEMRGDGGERELEELEQRYDEHMRAALGLSYPRSLFLYDVERSFYSARYLRAWLFEALLSKHLVHYFDEDWYRNPRCGTFLKKHWELGTRYGVEEMAREIGYEELTTKPLEKQLLRAL